MTRLEKLLKKWGVSDTVFSAVRLFKAPQRMCLDIGSRWTKVIVDGKYLAQPTCLLMHNSSGAVIAIGEKALQLQVAAGQNAVLIYPVEYGKITHTNALATYLTLLLKDHMYTGLSAFLVSPRISVGCLYADQPSQTKTCVQVLSSLSRKVSVHPLASILAKSGELNRVSPGIEPESFEPKTRSVIEIGASTTKFFLYHHMTCVSTQIVEQGSDQLMMSVQQLIRTEYHCAVGWQTAEECIRTLATTQLHKMHGKDVVTNLPASVEVPTKVLHRAVRFFIENVVAGFTQLCEKTAPEFVADIGQGTIYLSGGGSQIPGIKDALEKALNIRVLQLPHPQQRIVQSLWQQK